MKNKQTLAIIYAIGAAALYAMNVPLSKLLMNRIAPTFMAALLYLGAGIGIGILYLVKRANEKPEEKLHRADLPYVVAMIVLDIMAPILLMLGIKLGHSSAASLLGNFEIVATSLIALVFFKEKISHRLWLAIGLITLSSLFLSMEGIGEVKLSIGSLLVLAATVCWGLENNCTRQISDKSTYQIVTLKGIFSGLGALIISLVIGESFPDWHFLLMTLLLGFVAYGLSIFTYVRAQNVIGAAKTSSFYAVAPFVGAFLSFVLLSEPLSNTYFVALIIMILGTLVIIYDTLLVEHEYEHTHIFSHIHDGIEHQHVITHSHNHHHLFGDEQHQHSHSIEELEEALLNQ